MMTRYSVRILFALGVLFQITCSSHARQVISLDSEWRFLQDDHSKAKSEAFDDSAWQKVDIPHDWSIAGPFDEDAATTGSGGWLPSGTAWYRKSINVPEDAAGRRIWIEFDGIMANSDVWVNGRHMGHRPYGYVSFRYDVTDAVRPGGKNIVAVRCDTSEQPASRWYTGAGIYRHARMVIAEPVHIRPWGVFVTTPSVTAESAEIQIQIEVTNTTQHAGPAVVRANLEDPKGDVIATMAAEAVLKAVDHSRSVLKIKVPDPQLWNLETPHLYTVVAQVLNGDEVVDEVRVPFGIRTAEFKSDTGFWLNGRNLKIKGVCLHHDGGAVGAAVPLDVWERRLNILRSLGVNAIRTAHNPPAPGFLDLCDRMGFLVMDEFFDCWTKGKNPHDYHKYFKEWAHTDLRDTILRDRNHPSVILYSVGNEIHDTPYEELAKKILRGLVDVCHETDPSRPVTQALFRPNVSHDYDNGLADMLDVIGTNYRDQELLQAWKDKSGRKIIGTEQGHNRSTWLALRDNPQHAGQFLWCGIDYLGESRSWPLTVFNGGLLDRCGFVMPRGWQRQNWWSDQPMVKAFRRVAKDEDMPADPGYEVVEWKRRQVLFPDWNPVSAEPHTENVEVYSNADEVELFLNGESLGRKKTREDDGSLNWNVTYEPGTLLAVAYIGGEETARHELRTAGEPASLKLIPDQESVGLTFDDVITVEVQIQDTDGTIVPSATDRVHFSIEGPGKLIAVDSGNIVSTEPFQASERRAYQGRCIAILRGTDEGTVTLSAKTDDLQAASIAVHVESRD